MSKFRTLSFISALLLLFSFSAHASNVENICSRGQSTPRSDLSQKIDQLVNRFESQESRVANKEAFVRALDDLVSATPFSYLLGCRQEIQTRNLKYEVEFADPSEGDSWMAVGGGDDDRKVVFRFNLTKSVERVLFVYIHEMTHVCQRAAEVSISGIGNLVRSRIVDEGEAFRNQEAAFEYLVGVNSRLCVASGTGSDRPNPKLYQFYLDDQALLARGQFMRSVIATYMTAPPYTSYPGEIVNLNAPEIKYEGFSLKPLRPELVERLRAIDWSLILSSPPQL